MIICLKLSTNQCNQSKSRKKSCSKSADGSGRNKISPKSPVEQLTSHPRTEQMLVVEFCIIGILKIPSQRHLLHFWEWHGGRYFTEHNITATKHYQSLCVVSASLAPSDISFYQTHILHLPKPYNLTNQMILMCSHNDPSWKYRYVLFLTKMFYPHELLCKSPMMLWRFGIWSQMQHTLPQL